jgi:hypothetical protein
MAIKTATVGRLTNDDDRIAMAIDLLLLLPTCIRMGYGRLLLPFWCGDKEVETPLVPVTGRDSKQMASPRCVCSVGDDVRQSCRELARGLTRLHLIRHLLDVDRDWDGLSSCRRLCRHLLFMHACHEAASMLCGLLN